MTDTPLTDERQVNTFVDNNQNNARLGHARRRLVRAGLGVFRAGWRT